MEYQQNEMGWCVWKSSEPNLERGRSSRNIGSLLTNPVYLEPQVFSFCLYLFFKIVFCNCNSWTDSSDVQWKVFPLSSGCRISLSRGNQDGQLLNMILTLH